MGRLICEGAHRSQMVRPPFILRLPLQGHARLVIPIGVRDVRGQNGGHEMSNVPPQYHHPHIAPPWTSPVEEGV